MLYAVSLIFCFLGGIAEIGTLLCAVSLLGIYGYYGLCLGGWSKYASDAKAVRLLDIFGKLFLALLPLTVIFYFVCLALTHA